jgi:hypothetical protein
MRNNLISVLLLTSVSAAFGGENLTDVSSSGGARKQSYTPITRLAQSCGSDSSCCGTTTRQATCRCYYSGGKTYACAAR